MLNKKKTKILEKTSNSKKTTMSFLQYPKFSKNNFVQTGSNSQISLGVNTILNPSRFELTKNSNRFEYSSKQFREFFIFKSFVKKHKFDLKTSNLKRLFLFLSSALKKRKKIPFYLLKRVRGGYMVSVLGVICFVPRSLFKIAPNQQLVSLKLYKKTNKFTRSSLKLNIVSSLIHKNI